VLLAREQPTRRAADVPRQDQRRRVAGQLRTDIGKGDHRPPELARETFGAYATKCLKAGMSRLTKPLSPTAAG